MSETGTVLLIEDEKIFSDRYEEALRKHGRGYQIKTVRDLETAEDWLATHKPDVVVLDLGFQGKKPEDGLEFLRRIYEKKINECDFKVIVSTKYSTSGLTAVKLGAYDFIDKNKSSFHELPFRVNQAYERLQLERELAKKQQEDITQSGGFPYGQRQKIVGISNPMLELYEKIERIAKTKANVLIRGERGTGKELVAHAIHHYSLRGEHPFVIVNINAIPTDLVDAELFGIGKGRATGVRASDGRFVEAEGGTLFLDEIGSLQLNLQPKLLRAIQNKEIQPAGKKRQEIDVRIIAATNEDLERAVEENRFRSDLYDRLRTFELTVPPLRERGEDPMRLAHYFLDEFSRDYQRYNLCFSSSAQDYILTYPWPGNVRELRDAVERAVILMEGTAILKEHLLGENQRNTQAGEDNYNERIANFERQIILDALRTTGFRKREAARKLGLHEATLRSKIKTLAICP
ncbi:sigma-54-dependent Fis family transcriptional regulator [Candidatus Poribacteria bacterium]|nr:sigma-54-dependent Fis family transcriptional regulator [Candidatus Poribacteria bacterium]